MTPALAHIYGYTLPPRFERDREPFHRNNAAAVNRNADEIRSGSACPSSKDLRQMAKCLSGGFGSSVGLLLGGCLRLSKCRCRMSWCLMRCRSSRMAGIGTANLTDAETCEGTLQATKSVMLTGGAGLLSPDPKCL